MKVVFLFNYVFLFLKEIDPCSSQCHSIKKGHYKRSSNYTIQPTDIAISDNFLSEGWYRFESLAGNDTVTWAPSIYQCGTIYPMWMNGMDYYQKSYFFRLFLLHFSILERQIKCCCIQTEFRLSNIIVVFV